MISSIKEAPTLPRQTERASRQRQLLGELADQHQQLVESLLEIRELLKGSVYQLKTRCGKPSCHCAAPDSLRHATPVLSWSHQGKTQLRAVAVKDLDRFRRLTDNYRQFRQTRAALVKLHHQLLTTIDRLEKALRRPPPQPVSQRRKR
jgi:transcription initiation factor TFIID subunit TAF12